MRQLKLPLEKKVSGWTPTHCAACSALVHVRCGMLRAAAQRRGAKLDLTAAIPGCTPHNQNEGGCDFHTLFLLAHQEELGVCGTLQRRRAGAGELPSVHARLHSGGNARARQQRWGRQQRLGACMHTHACTQLLTCMPLLAPAAAHLIFATLLSRSNRGGDVRRPQGVWSSRAIASWGAVLQQTSPPAST